MNPTSLPQVGQHVELTISDTGMGMSEEVRRHIFEPFFTTKREGEGTGLGLATVYGIVRQNGGDIQVESQEGRGTTFRIYWPRTEEETAAVDSASSPAVSDLPSGDETVLLVEDNDNVREMINNVLRSLGYRVLDASHPAKAIALATQQANLIHLLLSDVMLPEMSGQQLAHKLVQIHPEMKVVLMSGYSQEIIARRGVIPPDIHFIQKPVTPFVLAHKIREALEN